MRASHLIIAAILLAGCSEQPTPMRVGTPYKSTYNSAAPQPPVAPAYYPGGPRPPSGALTVRGGGVRVMPPPDFPADDLPALGDAIEEYLRDAETQLGWQLPILQFGLPLWIVLNDVETINTAWGPGRLYPISTTAPPGLNVYDRFTRTAWVYWRRGKNGSDPAGHAFAPFMHEVLVEERRVDRGLMFIARSRTDIEAIRRGHTLDVVLATKYPWLFSW